MTAIYFDGTSSRRRTVALVFGDRLGISEQTATLATWSYGDIRRADAPPGLLRVSCRGAPSLARLEVRSEGTAAQLVARCPNLDETAPGRGVWAIVGWSLAATASIVLMVLFGVPLAADRLAPLIPPSFERRLGDVAEGQIKSVFDGKTCDSPAGQAAFAKLMNTLRGAAGLDLLRRLHRVVELGFQCVCVARRQGLPVQGAAGQGQRCRRDRGRDGARARASQASRQHPPADQHQRHLVPDRAAVRRRHRLKRSDFCRADHRQRVFIPAKRNTPRIPFRST